MAAVQSIFTGTQGLGLTHNGQTHTDHPESHCIQTSLCSMWILVLWNPNMDACSPHNLGSVCFSCTYMYMHIYMCMYIYIFSFLAITSMLRLNIIVQEWGKNQTLRRNTAAQGTLVSAVVSPSAFLSKSIWAPGAQQQEEERCGLHPLNLATQTPDGGYRKSISPCQTGVRDRTWKPQITKAFPLSGQLKQTQTNKSNSES